ncbi:MAG TPA: PAS domain S-box protein [Terrimicrobiaceae bacterium]
MNTDAEKIEEAFRSGGEPGPHSRELKDDRRRRELLELIFEHVADAIILTEPDGRIVDANPAASALLGYGRNELLEKYPWDFVTSASRDEIRPDPKHEARSPGLRAAYLPTEGRRIADDGVAADALWVSGPRVDCRFVS